MRITEQDNADNLKANRSLISGAFDNLTYYYYDENGTASNPATAAPAVAFTNKLAYVSDTQGAPVGDIGNQPANNYSYDKIGNLVADAAENIAQISWTLYGKIKAIKRNLTSKPDLQFRYDASGNRIAKSVVDALSGITTITYYVRDAQGNIMATYNETLNGNARTFRLAEHSLYGSSRLGTRSSNSIIGYNLNGQSTTITGMITSLEDVQKRGIKSYELGNHLGNVLAVVSDRKFPVDDGVYNSSGVKTSGTTDGICDYFYPEITSATDYYAFGAPMPGRQFNNGNYRYGFNGKENDNEVKGTGNQQDYGMRIYDPRIGRFLSVDPLTQDYPELTPYQFGSNRPIDGVDLDGAEWMKFELTRNDGKTQLKSVSVDVGFTNGFGVFVERDPYYTVSYNGSEYSFNNVDALKTFVQGDQSGYATDAQKTAEQFINTTSALVYMHGEAQIEAGNAALSKSSIDNNSVPLVLPSNKQQASANGGVKPNGAKKQVYIDPKKYPASAQHIEEAQAAGQPVGGLLNRSGAAQNRKAALSGVPTQDGMDRDEYPPAILSTGGAGSSVKYVPPSDNRGAGASMGNQLKGVPDGTYVEIKTSPTYNATPK